MKALLVNFRYTHVINCKHVKNIIIINFCSLTAKITHFVCIWFHVRELILDIKLILDQFLYIWFYIIRDFKIDHEFKIEVILSNFCDK